LRFYLTEAPAAISSAGTAVKRGLAVIRGATFAVPPSTPLGCAEGRSVARFGRIDEWVRRGKGLSGLVGSAPTPLEEGGSNDPLTFVRKD
jgi:hypothetical protein